MISSNKIKSALLTHVFPPEKSKDAKKQKKNSTAPVPVNEELAKMLDAVNDFEQYMQSRLGEDWSGDFNAYVSKNAERVKELLSALGTQTPKRTNSAYIALVREMVREFASTHEYAGLKQYLQTYDAAAPFFLKIV